MLKMKPFYYATAVLKGWVPVEVYYQFSLHVC